LAAKVLVCDDEGVLRALVRATLPPDQYCVIEAHDGEDGLDKARLHRPDVIVLDVQMPGRTGIDVLTELRSDPATAPTRVLVLSARAQRADRDEATRAGADLFLSKPFSPSELAAAVAELSEQRA
jgi:CheY-like chemotaxis protein